MEARKKKSLADCDKDIADVAQYLTRVRALKLDRQRPYAPMKQLVTVGYIVFKVLNATNLLFQLWLITKFIGADSYGWAYNVSSVLYGRIIAGTRNCR